ncbi:MAG: hypothetical protein L0G70_07800 [Rubrobacter sp.]|nr:hypothetical protein [Rubrobacter sp.]
MAEENAHDEHTPAENLEERVAELETLSQELGRAPDVELSGMLERAVTLVVEINTGIESRIYSAQQESGEVEGLLDRVDFGPFDAAMQSLQSESPEGSSGPE